MTSGLVIRAGQPHERARIDDFYRRAGYAGRAHPDDRVFVAADGDEWVGIVRLAEEDGVVVLRGMRVLASHQRRGVGRHMLVALGPVMDGRPCYCLPFAHLVGFYGQAGFAEIDPAGAPPFLAARLADYRRRRPEAFTLMRRP